MIIDDIEQVLSKTGGQAALAKAIGISRAVVWHWVHIGKRIPKKYIREIREVMKLIDKNNKKLSPVEQAIKLAGNQKELAEKCGVSQTSVSKWRKKGVIGARHVIKVEKAVGISRTLLNPEIYPPE